MNAFPALTLNVCVDSERMRTFQAPGCLPNHTFLDAGSLSFRVDQMTQASTILDDTVQGAAKVLSEAAAATKSSVDAAKQVSHRNPQLPRHVCRSPRVIALLVSFQLSR